MFLNIIIAVSLFADMEVELYHKVRDNDQPENSQILPGIKLKNTGSEAISLNKVTIEYYIYETGLSVSDLAWRYDWCNLGNIINVEFFDLENPYTEGDKWANMKFMITFTSDNQLAQNQEVEIQIGVYKNDWQHNFDETVHWSYVQNYSYYLSEYIVVRDITSGDGVIISGTPPPTDPGQPTKQELWESNQDHSKVWSGPTVTSVGIGTTDPQRTLDVFGNTKIEGNLEVWMGNITSTGNIDAVSYTGGELRVSGNVGIGTNFPQEILEVKGNTKVDGNITTREILVTELDWSDHVFNKGYDLTPLDELETYIKTHGHLPNIPTEKEVKKNGVNVGEIQAKLLEKIEEMTLYMIKMQKRINELEAKHNERK